MSIPRIAIHRPVTMFMLSAVIVMLGAISLSKLPVDLMPEFAAPVITVNTSDEGAAFGSAILAAVGVGAFKSVEEATDRIVKETSVTKPGRSYDKEYARFKKLYPAAKSLA